MLPRSHRYLCLAALLLSGCGKSTSTVTSAGPIIVPSEADVSQGKHASFRAYPSAEVTAWENLSGASSGYVSPKGTFYAPLTLPGERSITLEASNRRGKSQATVHLKPGPVEPSDCLAPGQPDPRDSSATDYIFVEELPEAIVRVAPSYPDLAREAGVQGTVMVQAFVCACGEVSDTRVVLSIPMLDQAAIDAVRQWWFKPGVIGGEAVAVWVAIPVKFALH
jgi:protein TonB